MRRGVIIAALVAVLLFGAAVLLYFLVPGATQALGALVEPVLRAGRRVADMTTGIMQRAAVVAQTLRAAGLDAEQAGAELAVLRNESDLEPSAFNYYADGKLHRGDWDGDPVTLPDGTDGKPRAHAVGVGQIIGSNRDGWGLDLTSAFDADANVRTVLARLNQPHWSLIMRELPDADLQLRTALLYIGHAEGGGPLRSALAACAAQGASWDAALAGVAADWGHKGKRPASGFYNRPAQMWLVGSYAAYWVDQYAAGLGAAAAAEVNA